MNYLSDNARHAIVYVVLAAVLLGSLWFVFVKLPEDCAAKGGHTHWEGRSLLCLTDDGRIIE